MRFSIFICFVLASLSAYAQTADEVVKRYVTFIGGKKHWKNVKTLTTTGEYNYGGLTFPFTTSAKAPNRYKVVVPLGGKFYAQAFDGTKGWKIDGFKNETTPTPLTGDAAIAMANEAEVALEDAFIDYASKGHRVELQGKETVDSVACFKVQLTRSGGAVETYYFDVKTYQLIMKVAASKNVEMGGAILHTHYSDYRDVHGIKLPFKSVSDADGQMILTVTMKQADVNKPIDDAAFQP